LAMLRPVTESIPAAASPEKRPARRLLRKGRRARRRAVHRWVGGAGGLRAILAL